MVRRLPHYFVGECHFTVNGYLSHLHGKAKVTKCAKRLLIFILNASRIEGAEGTELHN